MGVKDQIGADEGDKLRAAYEIRVSKEQVNPLAIAILVVGARVCQLMIQLGCVLEGIYAEQNNLRRLTMGEIDKIKDEEAGKPKIFRPFRHDA